MKRLSRAETVAVKAKELPVTKQRKRFFCTITSASAGGWGWVQKAPPLGAAGRLEKKWREIGSGLSQASSPLLRLLVGHGTDLQFYSGCQVYAAVWRFVKRHGRSCALWEDSWVADRIRGFCEDLGFEWVRPWVWEGPSLLGLTPDTLRPIDKVQHLLREAWRRSKWRARERSSRQDTTGEPFDSWLCARARHFAQRSQHHLAVLSGAYVSHARYSIMTHSEDVATCPYCQGAAGSKQHVWWDCLRSGRPPDIAPGSQKQRLLGWPSGTQQDDAVADYLADVRKRCLQLRYD